MLKVGRFVGIGDLGDAEIVQRGKRVWIGCRGFAEKDWFRDSWNQYLDLFVCVGRELVDFVQKDRVVDG